MELEHGRENAQRLQRFTHLRVSKQFTDALRVPGNSLEDLSSHNRVLCETHIQSLCPRLTASGCDRNVWDKSPTAGR